MPIIMPSVSRSRRICRSAFIRLRPWGLVGAARERQLRTAGDALAREAGDRGVQQPLAQRGPLADRQAGSADEELGGRLSG
jgi:hypothetical protein